ncbi:MAG: MFS transporter [Gaiella sp.]
MIPHGIERRALVTLSAGHVASDMFQGALPTLLLFFKDERSYSYSRLTVLVFVSSLASAFLQPLIGAAADRVHGSWMMPVGLLMAGGGFGLAGLVDDYWATATALFVGGVGVAVFHPEAISQANRISGARRGVGMSVFAIGGSAGFALGPAVATLGGMLFGVEGSALVGAILIVLALMLWRETPRFTQATVRARAKLAENVPSDWRRFGLAALGAISRGIVGVGLSTFIPLYMVDALDQSKGTAGAAVTAYFLSSLVGTVVGGRMADRHGFETVVVLGLLLATPVTFLLPLFGVAGVFLFVPVVGFLGGMYFYPLVVVAQQAVPRHLALAAGVVLGMSIGIGSIATALLGLLADAHGTTVCMWVIAAIGLASVPAAIGLRRA